MNTLVDELEALDDIALELKSTGIEVCNDENVPQDLLEQTRGFLDKWRQEGQQKLHERQQVLLDGWKQKHPLVNKATKGEYSFSETVRELAQKYGKGRLFLPISEDEEYDARLKELNLDLLFDVGALETMPHFSRRSYLGRAMDWFNYKCCNPIPMALFFGAFSALINGGQGRFESQIANYAASAGVGVATGIIAGLIYSSLKYSLIEHVQKDAQFLDTKIRLAYRG